MTIRFETPRTRTPVAGDLTCPECGRPLECGRSDRRNQTVEVHVRYSCATAPATAAQTRPAA